MQLVHDTLFKTTMIRVRTRLEISVDTYYFSTHGGACPVFSSFNFDVDGFFASPAPSFPVFRNECILDYFIIESIEEL